MERMERTEYRTYKFTMPGKETSKRFNFRVKVYGVQSVGEQNMWQSKPEGEKEIFQTVQCSMRRNSVNYVGRTGYDGIMAWEKNTGTVVGEHDGDGEIIMI